MLQSAILHYDFGPEGLATILSATDTQGLIDVMLDLLRSSDHKHVERTCRVIRDLVVKDPNHDLGAAFREAFHASAIVPELERLVLEGGYFIRKSAINTLGKTVCTDSLPALGRAFHLLLERDPLVLPDLHFEMRWLEGTLEYLKRSASVDAETAGESCATQDHDDSPLIDAMAASTLYSTRWAAIHILEGLHKFASLRQIERLRSDGHELVSKEAEYVYRRFLLLQRSSQLSKPERKKQYKEVKQYVPAASFFDMQLQFVRHLGTCHQADYSVEDLGRFIAERGGPR
jgi:hypothetical protein